MASIHPPAASAALDDIEELALCSRCRHPFDDTDRAPKLLACKHHFCLACVRTALGGGGGDVRCHHCWKRTELPAGGPPALPTHAAVLALARRLAPAPVCAAHALPALWCAACGARACRACPHACRVHALRPAREARAVLQRDARLLAADLQRLAARQRDFLLRALDAATALKVRLEGELAAPAAVACGAWADEGEGGEGAGVAAAAAERDRVRARHAEALLQCRLDDVVRGAGGPLDFERLRRALAGLDAPDACEAPPTERPDPVLFLANYCTAQLYTRHCLAQRALDAMAALELDSPCGTADSSPGGTSVTSVGGESSASDAAVGSPLTQNPSMYPLFYFLLEVDDSPFGRIVIEVHDDVAPRMARNFSLLATSGPNIGYRGCHVFQCWENESVITGDFEQNNGRGGHSVYEENHFMPDETSMLAVRGAVGMRRTQKRFESQGLVGSQFRIMLREMRGFTAIFACVVEGLELVDSLSHMGDSSGKPYSTIVISDCGKLN